MPPCIQHDALRERLIARGDDDRVVFVPGVHARNCEMKLQRLAAELVKDWEKIVCPLVAESARAHTPVDHDVMQPRWVDGMIFAAQRFGPVHRSGGKTSGLVGYDRSVEVKKFILQRERS